MIENAQNKIVQAENSCRNMSINCRAFVVIIHELRFRFGVSFCTRNFENLAHTVKKSRKKTQKHRHFNLQNEY